MLRPLILLSLLFTFGSAWALNVPVGPRVGYTNWDNVDQIHFGAHADLGDLYPNVELTPNLELGFGDDYTIISLNSDITYRFSELTSFPWGLHGGGCLSLNFIDHPLLDADLDLGFSLVTRLTHQLAENYEILGEVRLGILDNPDLKITFGMTFF